MSEHIAHLGICDDVLRLSLHHPAMEPALARVMIDRCEITHLGTVTRGADNWAADIVAWYRDEQSKPEAERDPRAPDKLAFALGALPHRAADRLMKPITRCWDDPVDREATKVYQDLCVFREVYGSGHGPHAAPFTADLLNLPGDAPAAAVEALVRVMVRRTLIALHTLAPDNDDIHGWLDGLFAALQTWPRDLHQYAEVAATWPDDKVKRYLTDHHFYQPDDPAIALARALQRGHTVTPEAVVAAVDGTTEAHSRYARALAKGIEYLLAAGELYRGAIDLAEAKRRLDVGVPELAVAPLR